MHAPRCVPGACAARLVVVLLTGCGAAPPATSTTATQRPPEVVAEGELRVSPSGLQPYVITLPPKVAAMPVPADNPLTVQGVELGRWLFYDPILSGNDTQACADCHQQHLSFTDGRKIAIGSEGKPGRRNTLHLVNLAWQTSFFWDGRAETLEQQVLMPIQDPLELNQNVDALIEELRGHPDYPSRFEAAFPGSGVTTENLAKALAQFLRTLVSFDAKIDRIEEGKYTPTAVEQRGLDMMTAVAYGRPEGEDFCDACHQARAGLVPGIDKMGMYITREFHNNGIVDSNDPGRGEVTGVSEDRGRFKVPSVRNITVTGPYMHDGRFATLREVLEYYNKDLPDSGDLDQELKVAGKPVRLRMTRDDIDALLVAAEMFTDERFLSNPAFSSPFAAQKKP